MIHQTAIIDTKANIDPSATIGPYAVIDGGVTIGAGCIVGPKVYITGDTTIGRGNRFHAGSVIGDEPQDLKYKGLPTRVRIGNDNVFREHVTVHRSTKLEEDTIIGSNNFFMATSHVGHNSWIGNHVIVANGAMLGGHVTVQDRAFISGSCLVHQFTRVGTLSLMQGGAGISKDLPPFTIARGVNLICGLNIIGLRRAGLTPEERLEIKKLYHLIFRSGEAIRDVLEKVKDQTWCAASKTMLDFIAAAKKGVCPDVSAKNRGGSEEDEVQD